MAYSAWSVIAGEQPTTSKWNILGTNDAGFNDGSAIAYSVNNTIPANALKTNAITLGYTQITASVTITAPTSDTQITGMTQAVTIPAGGRNVKITGYTSNLHINNNNATITFSIWDGGVGSGTELNTYIHSSGTVAGDAFAALVMAIVTPAAGSKTYNLGIKSSGGDATITAAATSPAFILVEAI